MGDLSDTELQEVARDVQRSGKLKELADELEMVPQLQSLQHNVNPPLTLLHRWHCGIMIAVEAHSLLVHHLKCIGLTETSYRYLALQDTEPSMLKMQNVNILCYFYVFYSLYYREFLTENPISVSQ